jgi:hypothetical protein
VNPQEAAARIDYLAGNALETLDTMHGGPANRPAHLVQLNTLLEVASGQAWHVARGTAAVEGDAGVWRLREPGVLRAVCDVPLAQPGGALALIPVLITWLVLGAAEGVYIFGDRSGDVAERPPFFAWWLDLPWFAGPLLLSGLVVLTVAVLIVKYVKPARERERADETDRVVQRLEAELLPPISTLWAMRTIADQTELTHKFGLELTSAARRFGGAAERLDAAVSTVERLGEAVGRLLDGLPHLGAHVTRLAEVEQRIGQGTQTLGEAVRPVAELTDDIKRAVQATASATTRAEGALDRSTTALAEANEVGAATAEQRAAVTSAEQPFAVAAGSVEAAARDLGVATSTLHETSKQLRTAIREANWIVMVADGLRAVDPVHGADEFSAVDEEPAVEPSA